MQIKVDYSIERKKSGKACCPGEYAIYTRNHFWEKWIEGSTFADYDWACREARRIRENIIPRYF